MLVKVRQFLTKEEYTDKPLPFRTMKVKEVKKETNKAILVSLVASPVPQSECIHCGREIKHPQSLHFGIGRTCLKKHYPQLLEHVDYSEIEQSYNRLKNEMEKITWEGWLPKNSIQFISEGSAMEIIFVYQSKQYRVLTNNPEKIDQIREKADSVISEQEVEV
jgi:hypothetical protein